MSTVSTTSRVSASTLVLQRATAVLLGAFVIAFVGFSHLEAAHNAGHDYRHSMAFPCH